MTVAPIYTPPASPTVAFFHAHPGARAAATAAFFVAFLISLIVRFIASFAVAGLITLGLAVVLGVMR